MSDFDPNTTESIEQAKYLINLLVDNDCYGSLNHIIEYLDVSRLPVDLVIIYLSYIKKYVHKEIITTMIPFYGELVTKCIREFNDRGLPTKELLGDFIL